MTPYPKYKPSGIEWIGDIPEHWEVKRGDSLFVLIKDSISQSEMDSKLVFHYSIPSVQEFGDAQLEDGSKIDSNKYIVVGNELLYSKLNPRKETIVLTTHRGDYISVCSTEFLVLKPQNINLKFSYYLFKCVNTKERICSTVESATKSHQRANPEEILKLWHAVPLPAEQAAIANYLDAKTVAIDELIAAKQKLIELYEEEKTALINHAVTKGLNPNAPMKDSGIDWLGEIPEHWEVKKLKYVSSINDETLSENIDENYEIEYIEISDVKSGVGILQTNNYSFKNAPSRARRIVRDGDIIVSTVRTYLKSIAKVNNPASNLIASTGFAVVRPSKLNSDYLGYLFYSELLIGEIISLSTGVSYPAISASQIADIKIPVPKEEEQQSIVAHIETESKKIDTQIANTTQLIELLTEYRTALISEVVTGKIKIV